MRATSTSTSQFQETVRRVRYLSPFHAQQTRHLAMPNSVPDALCSRREFENVVVSVNHEFCNVDLFEGISNAVGWGEEVGSGGFAIDVAGCREGGQLHIGILGILDGRTMTRRDRPVYLL
jgi:hypothetical protein